MEIFYGLKMPAVLQMIMVRASQPIQMVAAMLLEDLQEQHLFGTIQLTGPGAFFTKIPNSSVGIKDEINFIPMNILFSKITLTHLILVQQ